MTRKNVATAVKAAITAILIWLLLRHVGLAPVASRLLHLGPLQIILGLAPLVVQLLLAAERWRIVCGRLGVCLHFSTALQITTIGMFFNQTLPSAIGGDAMRVWLLVRDRVAIGKAINTVLCDRVFALLILLLLGAATLPLFYDHVADPHARLAVTACIIVGLAAFAIFLTLGPRVAHLLRRWKFSSPFGDLAHDFYRLFTSAKVVAALTVWSLSIHVLTIVAAWLIADLLGIGVNFLDCLIIMPSVTLIIMLPVSIAGWGLREGAMVVGFGLVGVAPSDALAISICLGLASILVGLPGGLLWLRNRQAHAPEIAPARD